jgi:hypothetical protein
MAGGRKTRASAPKKDTINDNAANNATPEVHVDQGSLAKLLAAISTPSSQTQPQKSKRKTSKKAADEEFAGESDGSDVEEESDPDVIPPRRKRSKTSKSFTAAAAAEPANQPPILDRMWRPWTLSVTPSQYERMAAKWVSSPLCLL